MIGYWKCEAFRHLRRNEAVPAVGALGLNHARLQANMWIPLSPFCTHCTLDLLSGVKDARPYSLHMERRLLPLPAYPEEPA
jgi:hypothetical protein